MGKEGTFWNLRSKGYEMGIAKGRAFSAKRSVGHFRVGRMPSAIPKKCEITMESMYLLSLHKKLAFDCTSVSDYISENIRPRPRARPRGHGNCSSCYAYRNKTVKRQACKHKRNTLFHQLQQSLDRLLSYGLLQQRDVQVSDESIDLFRDRPLQKKKICEGGATGPARCICRYKQRARMQRAPPVAYADTSKVLPDSDPTNKKSESTVTEPRGCGGPGRESEAGPGSREPEPRLTNAGLGQRADRGQSVKAEDFQVSLRY